MRGDVIAQPAAHLTPKLPVERQPRHLLGQSDRIARRNKRADFANRAAAFRAATLGCEGKWAIHPSQIAMANEVNSPSEAEVTKAHRIIEAMAEAVAAGQGAVALDGRLIDIASIKQAEVMVKKSEMIAAKS